MNILCRIMAIKKPLANSKIETSQKNGVMVIIEVVTNRGSSKQIIISRSQDLILEMGYKIKCISGQAAVWIKPATNAGIYIISEMSPIPLMSKYPSEIEINDFTTRIIDRGHVQVTEDIGNISKHAGGCTR